MTASFATDRSSSPAGTLKRLALSRTESTSSAHQQQSKRRRQQHSRPSSAGPSSRNHSRTSTTSELLYEDAEADIPEEESQALLNREEMRDSFHSDRSKKSVSTIGESQRRGRNWSRMARSAPLPPLSAVSGGEAGHVTSGSTTPIMRQTSLSRDRDRPIVSRSRTSQSRSRSVMFLSVWGSAVFVRYAAMPGLSMLGTSLSSRSEPNPAPARAWRAAISDEALATSSSAPGHVDVVYAMTDAEAKHPEGPHVPAIPNEPPIPPPSKEVDMRRSIGRISAWIAVVFYLTSRMPQICK
jgi:hypothetical protein